VKTLQWNTGKQCGKTFVGNQYEKLARGFGKRMLEVTIYSGKESQINWANLHAINRKAYFVVDRDVYTYANRMLIKRLSIHYPQFNWAIFGRSEVDLFVGMKDGLAHYDGTDTEYIYNFPGNHMGAVNEPIIFEKEIFLGISSPRNMVLHGRLKE
jgi:hypothetical protein